MPGQRPRRDHYAVLGVPRSASAQQITSAYRRLVRALHPDARPQDPAAAEDLADVLAAYDTLRDPQRRAAYDAGRGSPASRAAAGQPVAVRVTRTARPAGARPASPSRARRQTSSLLDGLDGPLFPGWSRIGPRFVVLPPGWGDRSFVSRVVREWLRHTGAWLR